MKQKYDYEQWENSIILIARKLRQGNLDIIGDLNVNSKQDKQLLHHHLQQHQPIPQVLHHNQLIINNFNRNKKMIEENNKKNKNDFGKDKLNQKKNREEKY